MATLRLTLKRSKIGSVERQQATLRGLGLHKIGGTVEREDSPSVRGMVKKVLHLVEVREVE
jgi:large subunit ribosomal protein L30